MKKTKTKNKSKIKKHPKKVLSKIKTKAKKKGIKSRGTRRKKETLGEVLNQDSIIDSKVGKTDALFVSNPDDPDITEALKEFDDLEKSQAEIKKEDTKSDNTANQIKPNENSLDSLNISPDATQEKEKSFWEKIISFKKKFLKF
jgi:hypothetical protein